MIFIKGLMGIVFGAAMGVGTLIFCLIEFPYECIKQNKWPWDASAEPTKCCDKKEKLWF